MTTVIIRPQPRPSVQISPQTKTVTVVNLAPQAELNDINQINNVDVGVPEEGETLVYDQTTGKYVVKILPKIQGGLF